MALYVLALSDAPVPVFRSAGRVVRAIEVMEGLWALTEERRTVPRATDDQLRWQHTAVVKLSQRVNAILPVRFGTLLSRRALRTLVAEHQAELHAALERVNGRVQMTMRVLAGEPRRVTDVAPPASGREYLARRQAAASPPLPRGVTALLRELSPVVLEERRDPGAVPLLATIYHLVDRGAVVRYRRRAARVTAGVFVTGPWPPFAFTPRLL